MAVLEVADELPRSSAQADLRCFAPLEVAVPESGARHIPSEKIMNLEEAVQRHPLGFFSPGGARTANAWETSDAGLWATIPLSQSLPLLSASSLGQTEDCPAEEEVSLEDLEAAVGVQAEGAAHFFSLADMTVPGGEWEMGAEDDCRSECGFLSTPSLSEASLGCSSYSEFSDCSDFERSFTSGASTTEDDLEEREEDAETEAGDASVNPGRYVLQPGGLCSHRQSWRRVRTKRGLQFYTCMQCDVLWCTPANGKKARSLKARGVIPAAPQQSAAPSPTPSVSHSGRKSKRPAGPRHESGSPAACAPPAEVPRYTTADTWRYMAPW